MHHRKLNQNRASVKGAKLICFVCNLEVAEFSLDSKAAHLFFFFFFFEAKKSQVTAAEETEANKTRHTLEIEDLRFQLNIYSKEKSKLLLAVAST